MARKSCGGLPKLPVGGLSPKAIDLRGQQFGQLRVKSYHHSARGYLYWTCICSCGKHTVACSQGLRAGRVRSCGCLKRALLSKRSRLDLTGRVFNKLTVLRYLYTSRNGHAVWRCRCQCGTVCSVAGSDLRSAHVKSCGCFRRAFAEARKGRNHPCWNAKLDQESRDKRRFGSPTQLHFKRVAKLARIRDSNSCVVCGRSKCILHAHHLEPWAYSPSLRYNPANLITLCEDCHYQFHALYGRDCDLDDFTEFMKN